MARKRITEFTAKKLLKPHLNSTTNFFSVSTETVENDINQLSGTDFYVVKVDQGIKGRMKKGLVMVNVQKKAVKKFIQDNSKNFSNFFVEEYIPHSLEQENFLSLERTSNGVEVYYSNMGGINIEEHKNKIKKLFIQAVAHEQSKLEEIARELKVSMEFLNGVFQAFDELYFSFLEINPLVVNRKENYIIDLAVEVDSTAEFFVKGAWRRDDFIDKYSIRNREEEITVSKLANESQAAFSLQLLNEDGAIFLLLSGGGASLVIADEVYNLGHGRDLGNYGEFSGNPNAEETYIYTKAIVSVLLRSKAKKKALLIGGGVANFTDIRITSMGIVKALEEQRVRLKKQGIAIFVRRGGPHQEEGLSLVRTFIKTNSINGLVFGPETVLTEIVRRGIDFIKITN